MDEPLDPVGARVLGSLIEKEFTTPDSYPLTLNALRTACNQTSNREPVMELDEDEVRRGLDELSKRGFARGLLRSSSRVMRFRQELGPKLHLHEPELAALCVLLLRGPQTAGEIRSRTERMVQFIETKHVEITLDALATLSTPLVTQLPLRPGQKEPRYAHLLSGEPPPDDEPFGQAEEAGRPRAAGGSERIRALEEEVASLREEVTDLRERLEAFMDQFE